MTVTNSRLNRHEKDILNAIKKNMPDGIHVKKLIRDFKMSPTTVNHYLSTLEKDHKEIVREKIQNRFVYRIKSDDELSFDETQNRLERLLYEFEISIVKSITHSQNWGISERLEIYQNITNVISSLKYLLQFIIDVEKYDKKSMPDIIVKQIKKLDEISKKINNSMNPLLRPLFMTQIDLSVSESLDYLKSIPTRKKGKQSKYINKVLGEMKLNPKVYSILNNADKEIKKVSRIKK